MKAGIIQSPPCQTLRQNQCLSHGPESADDHARNDSPEQQAGPERIAKRLARAGLCSRRDAERWIADGRVAVNGVVLTSPAVTVGPKDQIVVDGNPLPDLEPTRLWRYHKPDGLVTSARDEKGRQTVFDVLPEDLPRVISVGRLDLTTEGLLLLTNDGELARFLELPTTGWARRYRVRVNGFVDPDRLLGLARGIAIDGIQYGPIEAVLDRQQGANAWMTVTLREGKNREVRNVMESMGLTVNRLIRVALSLPAGKLERGEVEEVPSACFTIRSPSSSPTGATSRPSRTRARQGEAEAEAPAYTTFPR